MVAGMGAGCNGYLGRGRSGNDLEEGVGGGADAFALVKTGGVLDLGAGEVNGAIGGEGEAVGPLQAGVLDDGLDGGAGGGGEAAKGAVLQGGEVEVAGGVAAQAVDGAGVGDFLDLGGELVGGELGIAEGGGVDPVEGVGAEGVEIEGIAVGAELDAVGVDLGGLAVGAEEGLAEDSELEAGLGVGGGSVVEDAADVAGIEVEDEEGAETGIGEVGGVVEVVDADVVEVALGGGGLGVDGVDAAGFVLGEVDGDEFDLIADGGVHAGGGGVEDPEGVLIVAEDALDAEEGVAHGRSDGAGGDAVLVPFVGIGLEVSVGEEFGDGEAAEVVPMGEAEEDPTLLGNGDAGGLAVGELGRDAQSDGVEKCGGEEKEECHPRLQEAEKGPAGKGR